MLNPFADVNWNPNIAERRKFGRSLVIGFPIVAIILALVFRITTNTWKPFPFWLGTIGLTLGVVFWILPQIARPFYSAWYFLACCMGFVVGNVLLSALFYLLVTPIGLAVRLSGRKLLCKCPDKSQVTYWREAQKVVDFKRYFRQF